MVHLIKKTLPFQNHREGDDYRVIVPVVCY